MALCEDAGGLAWGWAGLAPGRLVVGGGGVMGLASPAFPCLFLRRGGTLPTMGTRGFRLCLCRPLPAGNSRRACGADQS